MNKYNEIQRIIADAGDSVDFAEYGDGVSEKWIMEAENRLGFSLPHSYKWWLRHYGGGEIYGEEIFSIYEQDFDMAVGGDIVYNYELNTKRKNYSEDKVLICETNDDVFYFDLSKGDDKGELPIYSLNNDGEKYANDFIDFLKKRIIE